MPTNALVVAPPNCRRAERLRRGRAEVLPPSVRSFQILGQWWIELQLAALRASSCCAAPRRRSLGAGRRASRRATTPAPAFARSSKNAVRPGSRPTRSKSMTSFRSRARKVRSRCCAAARDVAVDHDLVLAGNSTPRSIRITCATTSELGPRSARCRGSRAIVGADFDQVIGMVGAASRRRGVVDPCLNRERAAWQQVRRRRTARSLGAAVVPHAHRQRLTSGSVRPRRR